MNFGPIQLWTILNLDNLGKFQRKITSTWATSTLGNFDDGQFQRNDRQLQQSQINFDTIDIGTGCSS